MIKPRKRSKKKPKFIRLFTPGRLAFDRLIETNKSAARILLALSGHANRRGIVMATIRTLSVYLGISEYTVSRSIGLLVQMRYLQRVEGWGRSAYAINAAVIWGSSFEDAWTAPFFDGSVIPERKEWLYGPPIKPEGEGEDDGQGESDV